MLSRGVLILAALFWLTMNVQLWRAEFGSPRAGSSPVPVALVWQKILTSPDSSLLTVFHRGQKIGYCHWITSVGEEWAQVSDQNLPVDAPGRLRSYRLQLDGSLILPDLTNRVRFSGRLKVDGRRAWQELETSVTLRSISWRLRADVPEQRVKLTVQDGEGRIERRFSFAELADPGALLAELREPLIGVWPEPGAWPVMEPAGGSFRPELKWQAFDDVLSIGRGQARAYRLQARLLDRYQVVVFVSHVGEILRVELPDDLVLVNDQLSAM